MWSTCVAAFVGLCTEAAAASNEASAGLAFACPAEIPPTAIVVKMNGWRDHAQASALTSVDIVEGPLEENGVLKPMEGRAGGKHTSTYMLEGGPEQKWLMCGYGRDGNLNLAKRLPTGVKECVVAYAPRSDTKNLKPETIICHR